MNNTRETIELSDFILAALYYEYATEGKEYDEYFDSDTGDQIKEGPWDAYNFIQEEIDYIDLEKGYIEYDVIIQRKSDSKYFHGSYIRSPYIGRRYNNTLEEVIRTKENKITYIFE